MKGIEKITARIAADAESEISAIRGESDKVVAQIRADYDKRMRMLPSSVKARRKTSSGLPALIELPSWKPNVQCWQ